MPDTIEQLAQLAINRAMAPGVREHFAELSTNLIEKEYGMPPSNYSSVYSGADILQQISKLNI